MFLFHIIFNSFHDREQLILLLIFHSWLPWSDQSTDAQPLRKFGTKLDRNSMLESNEHCGNLLWGIWCQFVWQRNSGRHHLQRSGGGLHDKDASLIEHIPKTSWWGSMNYWLTVPLLFAAKRVFPNLFDVKIKLDNNNQNDLFCSTIYGPYQNENGRLATSYWQDYFEAIVSQQVRATKKFKPNEEEFKSNLAKLMWKAHSASLIYAEPIFRQLLDKESRVEREFCLGLLFLFFLLNFKF